MTANREAVHFANEVFYRAFAARDVEAMQELWARDAPVAVIHPGWQAFFGREDVMKSWEAVLGGPNSPDISCHEARVQICGDSAYVICYERVSGGFLVATNLFVLERGLWRMVHHQAGPTQIAELPEEDDPPGAAFH